MRRWLASAGRRGSTTKGSPRRWPQTSRSSSIVSESRSPSAARAARVGRRGHTARLARCRYRSRPAACASPPATSSSCSFSPPGVQNLGIFLDPNPPEQAAADQVARIAASEAWDCLRAGGRVTLWAPGCEPSQPDEERDLVALLRWLARYPKRSVEAGPPPLVGAAVAVTTQSDRRLLDAIEEVRTHGGPVRAWVVGEAALQSDIEVERAGLGWPPR